MECVGIDLICHAGDQWVVAQSIDFNRLTDALRQLLGASGKYLGLAFQLLRSNLEAAFGFFGFVFGVWRWWRYRERILHERLREYLSESDRRLDTARRDVLEAIVRPGPRKRFSSPVFAVGPLRRVLYWRGWDSITRTGRLENYASRQLDRALLKLSNRLETTQRTLSSYQEQQASAHILKGAIASASADTVHAIQEQQELDYAALDHFRTALTVPGFEKSIEAKEYEAHQLLKLSLIGAAFQAYDELESFAVFVQDPWIRARTTARAKRYKAQILQAQAVGGAAGANAQIGAALNARQPFQPFRNWDQIEQAEMHYIRAYIAHRLNFTGVEGTQLNNAATEYRRAINSTPKRFWMNGRESKALLKAAKIGLTRVANAQTGAYDVNWLLPNLPDNPEQPPAAVGNGGGDQSVQETTQGNDVDDVKKS